MKSDAPMDRLIRESLGHATARAGTCLDAETVAAWADGTLDARERASVEAHAAGCVRCQSMLAMMVRTGDVAPEEHRRAWTLGWVVPLAVGAAAVLFWVRVPQPRTPEPQQRVAVDAVAPATTPRSPSLPPAAAPDRPVQLESRQAFAKREKEAAQAPSPDERRRDEADQKGRQAAANEAPLAAAAPAERAASAELKADLLDAARPIVASPDPRVLWRIVGGRVQRSSDGGQTWQAQSTVGGPLTAGSAPTSSICWMVGRQGTIVLSTDGGSWRRIPFPDATIDLVAVAASDDRSAIVTASDGRKFRTSDGGATWVLQPPQEFPAAPF